MTYHRVLDVTSATDDELTLTKKNIRNLFEDSFIRSVLEFDLVLSF